MQLLEVSLTSLGETAYIFVVEDSFFSVPPPPPPVRSGASLSMSFSQEAPACYPQVRGSELTFERVETRLKELLFSARLTATVSLPRFARSVALLVSPS